MRRSGGDVVRRIHHLKACVGHMPDLTERWIKAYLASLSREERDELRHLLRHSLGMHQAGAGSADAPHPVI